MQQSQINERIRLRNLAMQLAVQLHPFCDNEKDAHEVADLLHGAIAWQYDGTAEPATVLKIVG
jgi:hypothetical protein